MYARTTVWLLFYVTSAYVISLQAEDVGPTNWEAPPFQKEIYNHTGIAAMSGLSPSRLFWNNNPTVTENLSAITKGVTTRKAMASLPSMAYSAGKTRTNTGLTASIPCGPV